MISWLKTQHAKNYPNKIMHTFTVIMFNCRIFVQNFDYVQGNHSAF
jgi:hypothetical protein